MASYFLFTEVVRCGQIGIIALRSFFTYHPNETVHVFGLESDREAIAKLKNVIFHSLDKPSPELEGWSGFRRHASKKRLRQIAKNFDHGHLGTASLWAYLIQTRPEEFIVHFDSDIVFRSSALKDITEKLESGYDLVGAPRAYKNNPNNRDDVRHLKDVTQTFFFGFNKNKISKHSYKILTKMCQGSYNPTGDPVIDFFDPVAFDILKNRGKIFFLSTDDYGGCDLNGSRTNKYPKVNALIDFGKKTAHFAAVGSGMNFYQNHGQIKKVPNSYISYGLERYAVYIKLFYNKDIKIPIKIDQYKPLFQVKKWY